MATPSNINKTINDEQITPDAKRVKLFSGPDGEKMDSINESQQPQPESLDTQSLILCSSDGQSFDLTTVIKNAILNPEFFSMVYLVVIRLSNPFFHHRALKTILLVLHQE
jgi:hypothetical protein